MNNDKNKYNKTKEECETKFQNQDCYEAGFESSFGTYIKIELKVKELNLYYGVIELKEEDESSIYKLLIDLLNILSILFGQNSLKLLSIIYCLLNAKFQLRSSSKYCLYFIYLICLAGFICHTYFIFDQVLHGELVHYVYYTLENSIRMPEIIFCFDLNQKRIDRNYKLTENYLNEATSDLRIETFFESITYLGESNKWINLGSNFENSEFKIEIFYFLNKKCFKMSLAIEYYRDRFYLLDDQSVLKVYFNYKYGLDAYFLTKISNTMQFSRLSYLLFDKNYYIRDAYILSQETIELTKKDKFYFIKSPSLLFHKDKSDDNNNLITKFERDFDLSTLYLPFKKGNSNTEIDDDLFEQHSSQVSVKSSLHSNIRKLFIINNYKVGMSNIAKPDFVFELNFIKNQVLITNEDNFTKLIINLLNVLSLWFSFCILDFYAYVYKIKFIFLFIFKLLIRIKIALYRLILFNLFVIRVSLMHLDK